MSKPEKIRPGIVVRDEYGYEKTVYPTGMEWIIAFALKGCQWAIDYLESDQFRDNNNRLASDHYSI